MQTGNLPEAVRTLRARAKEKPGDATLQYLLGEALIRSGASPASPEFVEARAAFAASTKLKPKFLPSFGEPAKMNLKEKFVDEAVALFERARSPHPRGNAPRS